MMLLRKHTTLFLFLLLLIACHDTQKQEIQSVIETTLGKELSYPSGKLYVLPRKNCEVAFADNPSFTIFNYVDSLGCTSCKLQLEGWKNFIKELNDNCRNSIQLIFLIHPQKTDEIKYFLEKDKFHYPVLIDKNNDFIIVNHLSKNIKFQTFLLDKNNKILAIGNPIRNPKVKDLYLKIIQGERIGQKDESKTIQTEIVIDKTSVSFGRFDWQEEQKTTFTLKNAGDNPLIIQDITTSCGCTTVAYSKEPIRSGKEIVIEVGYKAEGLGYFNKTIMVYCNAEISPLKLKISGNAEEIKKKI